MNLYLAGLENHITSPYYEGIKTIVLSNKVYALSSYFYIKKRAREKYSRLIPYFKDFMLDSGAFSFMNSGIEVNWNSYIEEYSNYINENKINKFFELDIDSIIGYDKVKEYRKRLEKLVNRPCIPVWHRSRELDEFFRLCDEYSYIAVGGIAIGHIRRNEYKNFSYLIKEAHKRKCKIHGLGFTNLSLLKKYHFDSVDSSSWTSGGRFGKVYKFIGNTLVAYYRKENQRLINYIETDAHNFNEWIKFQRYAEVHY